MTTKKDLITSIVALTQGMHPRVGEESPAQLLSSLPAQIIGEFICEEERLLEAMLNDYYLIHSPIDEGEVERDMEEMRKTYLDNPSPASLSRMSAYSNGTQCEFLSQSAEIIICQACGVHCYYIGKLVYTPVCSQCRHDDTILEDISVREIPPWIDIDTFYWTEPDMPDPETYADAYGWGSPQPQYQSYEASYPDYSDIDD